MIFDTIGDVSVEFFGCGVVFRDESVVLVLLFCVIGFFLVYSGLFNYGYLVKNF